MSDYVKGIVVVDSLYRPMKEEGGLSLVVVVLVSDRGQGCGPLGVRKSTADVQSGTRDVTSPSVPKLGFGTGGGSRGG